MKRILLTIVAIFSICQMFPAAVQQPASTPEKVVARATPVQVGETAPDFTLEDEMGRKVTLSEARGKTPTVLVFYRGYW